MYVSEIYWTRKEVKKNMDTIFGILLVLLFVGGLITDVFVQPGFYAWCGGVGIWLILMGLFYNKPSFQGQPKKMQNSVRIIMILIGVIVILVSRGL